VSDQGVVVLGIPIPSSSPIFLSIVAVHVAAGLVCTIAGIAAMLTAKRAGRHPAAGTVYYWSLFVVFLTMAALSILRWPHNTHLFVLGILSFGAGTLGRTARRRLWRGWLRLHITGMAISYILLSQPSMSTMDRTCRCGDRCRPWRIGSYPASLAFLSWSGHSDVIRSFCAIERFVSLGCEQRRWRERDLDSAWSPTAGAAPWYRAPSVPAVLRLM
jgi:hypothetical protein